MENLSLSAAKSAAQELIVAGGAENLVASRLRGKQTA